MRISVSNAVYTMFRGSVKSTGYPLHSPVSRSLPLPCVTVCHHISTGVYHAVSSGVKRLGREADHSSQSNIEGENEWSCTSTCVTLVACICITFKCRCTKSRIASFMQAFYFNEILIIVGKLENLTSSYLILMSYRYVGTCALKILVAFWHYRLKFMDLVLKNFVGSRWCVRNVSFLPLHQGSRIPWRVTEVGVLITCLFCVLNCLVCNRLSRPSSCLPALISVCRVPVIIKYELFVLRHK
jgi:hypothetical protein